MTSEERNALNEAALANPKPGDYWSEMFCPYFIVVEAKSRDNIVVLNCLGGTKHHNPEWINARVDNCDGTWSFDYDKTMVVNADWIKARVTYSSISGFVADVIRVDNSRKASQVLEEYRQHKADRLQSQIKSLTDEYEKVTGWKYLKEE